MGSNSLTIAPGEVITYDRNDITNDMLVKRGIKVHTIPGSELSKGRGGPPMHEHANQQGRYRVI